MLSVLLRLLLAVVLVTPGAGVCALGTPPANDHAATAAADLPPCHGGHADTPSDQQGDPADGDRPDGDRCGDGGCDCGCPCRALTGLTVAVVDLSAAGQAIAIAPARPAPLSGTTPPPPTPPPIA